jgi:beta-glucanase (GH16 family)
MGSDMFAPLAFVTALVCGWGGGASGNSSVGAPPEQNAATPSVTTRAAQNGATIVALADSTSGATIYYTLDGSTPTKRSMQYFAPFLIASTLTLKAIASAPGYLNSTVVSKDFTTNIASGTLVWSDEFANAGTPNLLPDSKTWTYDTGYRCCGNNELETYCAAGSAIAPCDPTNPNAYIDSSGVLHVLGRKPSGTTYTSARLKTQGVFSFMYGRIEARLKLPESQGMWPAFWLLGNNIASLSWPACGELDVMEHIDGKNPPFNAGAQPAGYDWIAGSIHGGSTSSHLDGSQKYHPQGFSAAEWHTYGMIWTKGQVQFYVDDPQNVYATFTPANFGKPWPFDAGPQFIILNLAIGGDWPGSPDATTVFPGDMQVDYVRIYTN